MCRCAERRVALTVAARAAMSGDASKIAPALAFNAMTLREDARAGLQAARAALKRRAGR